VVKSEVKDVVKGLTSKEKEEYEKVYTNKKVDKKKYPTINDFINAQVELKNKKTPIELKLWSNGDNVKKLQKALGIKIDGNFGESTELAVKKYQKNNGLTQDGVVGPKTWEKIT
jgi:peptidoglycan hydrolase-like protein with peptidoglycan-binding domain